MEKHTFICGSVRNCGKYIDDVFANIGKIIHYFNDYRILLSVDVSKDNTLLKLQKYQQIYADKMIVLVNDQPLSPIRVERISNSRNRILERIRQFMGETPNYWRYFIMMDFDDVCSCPINEKIIPYYLSAKSPEWDCLTFNRKNYYDIWALSFENYIYSCWSFPNPQKVINDMKKRITRQLSSLTKYDLYRCYSAFNGFGIYRLDKFIDCEYRWIIDLKQYPRKRLEANFKLVGSRAMIKDPNQDCEHRSFHFQAIQKHDAKIMISPHILFLQ
jgi:hypothetical protein